MPREQRITRFVSPLVSPLACPLSLDSPTVTSIRSLRAVARRTSKVPGRGLISVLLLPPPRFLVSLRLPQVLRRAARALDLGDGNG